MKKRGRATKSVMEFFPASAEALVDLQGATLLVPTVAAGNVGELAIDILLCSLNARLVGCMEDANVLPLAGNDPFTLSDPGTLTIALELFEVPTASGPSSSGAQAAPRVYLLQQRAPAMLGRQADFAEDVAEWAQSRGVAQLLVLSGLDATLRKDRQLEGPPTRYCAGSAPQLAAAAEAQGVAPLETEYLAAEREAHGLLPPWPLLAACARRGLPHLLLGCFAAEGDNVPHAMAVAQCTLRLLAASGLLSPPSVESAGQGQAQQQQPVVPLRMPCSFAALYGRSGMDVFLG